MKAITIDLTTGRMIYMWANTLGIPLRAALFAYTTIYYESRGFAESWVWDKEDKGGPTSWGIASNFAPPEEKALILAKKLTLNRAVKIAYQRYYLQCAERVGGPTAWANVPFRIAFVIFDACFHGELQTAMAVQRELARMGLYSGAIDGSFGPMSAAAAAKLSDQQALDLVTRLQKQAPAIGALVAAKQPHYQEAFVHRARWRFVQAAGMPRPA